MIESVRRRLDNVEKKINSPDHTDLTYQLGPKIRFQTVGNEKVMNTALFALDTR